MVGCCEEYIGAGVKMYAVDCPVEHELGHTASVHRDETPMMFLTALFTVFVPAQSL